MGKSLIAKMTTKHQITIPKLVREALHLRSQDHLAFEILPDQTVILRRVTPLDIKYYQALALTLNEWDSEEDDKAYGNL